MAKFEPLQNCIDHGKLGQPIEHVLLTCSIIKPADDLPYRRGARAAESGSLENCCRGNSTVGSNPTLSAIQSSLDPEPLQLLLATG